MNKNLKIAFFSEAGKSRGLGHLVRSYTIYQKFKAVGINSSFFLDSDIDLNYKFSNLNYFTWDKFYLKESYDIIFIDSYEAKLEIYQIVSNSCKIAVYLDDYKRLKYPKGVIINFSPEAAIVFYKEKKSIYTYLLGLEYIPIREVFLKKKPLKKEQLFIMLGGSDTLNLSEKISICLDNIDIYKVIVVNNIDTAKQLKKYQNIKILYQPTDEELITEMMLSSIAISTASMTLYELSYLNIPTILITASKNQEIGIKHLLKNKMAAFGLNIKSQDWQYQLIIYLKEIRNKEQKYIAANKIDGKGAKRIVDKILLMEQI